MRVAFLILSCALKWVQKTICFWGIRWNEKIMAVFVYVTTGTGHILTTGDDTVDRSTGPSCRSEFTYNFAYYSHLDVCKTIGRRVYSNVFRGRGSNNTPDRKINLSTWSFSRNSLYTSLPIGIPTRRDIGRYSHVPKHSANVNFVSSPRKQFNGWKVVYKRRLMRSSGTRTPVRGGTGGKVFHTFPMDRFVREINVDILYWT